MIPTEKSLGPLIRRDPVALKRKKGMVMVEARPRENGDAVYLSDGFVTERTSFDRLHLKPNPVAMSSTDMRPTNFMFKDWMPLLAPTTSWISASGPACDDGTSV